MLRTTLLFSIAVAWAATPAQAADWPMWGHDAARTGVSPESLPQELELAWTLKLRKPDPAWHATEEKIQFDRMYEPIVADGRMFVGSMTSDRLTAYDAESGRELWRHYADGPVRFAPAAYNDNVYFVSDDGYLYCVRADDGSLRWKFRGGPSERKVLGNDRLINIYPARGAPVVDDGNVYFAASIWPLMGVFIHALDAETGEVLWTNSGTGSMYIPQQHDGPAFSGIAPQGYLAATEELLLVAGGQTVPAAFDRRTGELVHYNLHSRRMGSKGGGGYQVRVGEGFFVNRGDMYRLADGKFVAKAFDPLLPQGALLGVDPQGEMFWYGAELRQSQNSGATSDDSDASTMGLRWKSTPEPRLTRLFMMAGKRAYGTTAGGDVAAVELAVDDSEPRVVWTQPVDGTPLNMIAAEDRLYVTTDRGDILCFAEQQAGSGDPRTIDLRTALLPANRDSDRWSAVAREILEQTDAQHGYCLLAGIGSGRLLEELITQSEFTLIVLDPDPDKVAQMRRQLDDRGLYGSRVAAHVGDIRSLELPPYFARLIVSEDLAAAGFTEGPEFCQKAFHPLRPYGGALCLALDVEQHESFAADVQQAGLASAELTRASRWSLLRRVGRLPGSGDWTHHNGDAANTVFSEEQLVRAPLGILWFGGPSNAEVLPRHGHGPAPQVVGGRLFIEGEHMLRAVDVYTGQLLWQREFRNLGEPYTSVAHAPGAGVVGGNYVSVDDGVYVIHERKCQRLDPATGRTTATFTAPPTADGESPPEWGFLSVAGDVLIGGVEPYERASFAFSRYELRKYDGDRARPIRDALAELRRPQQRPRRSEESESLDLRGQLNRLLFSEQFLESIPPDVRRKANQGAVEQKLRDYLSGKSDRANDPPALKLKRQLLAAYYPLPSYSAPPVGSFGNSSRTASRRLVAFDRRNGELLWDLRANETFRHNGIAAGNGKVFALDRLPTAEVEFLRRQGMPHRQQRQIVAVDAKTGQQMWQTSNRIFGTWLGYSAEFDVLLQAGSAAGDRAMDEVDRGMVAYRGADGDLLWQNDLRYSGPCILRGQAILTQPHPGFSLNLLTGEKNSRLHPLSGIEADWTYSRNRGCNTAIASEHLITFRSSSAGYYDLAGDGGTGNLGGFRSGCTANLIPACGVLSAPDYTRTCTCAFQNRTSLALVHMPEVEMWTFNRYQWDGERIRRLGLNFAAPGDRRAASGLLWLDYPSVGGDSPDVPITIDGQAISYFRHHPSRITSGDLRWVAASGIEGATSISISLSEDAQIDAQPYTVRLIFAETEHHDAGARAFDVLLQGKPALVEFDIVGETGSRNRSVVKTFRDVQAGAELHLELAPRRGAPVLSGVEIVAQEQ